MITDLKSMQLLKADSSILVTELSIIIDCRPVQELNAHFPILVTKLGISEFLHPDIKTWLFVSIIALQLFSEL